MLKPQEIHGHPSADARSVRRCTALFHRCCDCCETAGSIPTVADGAPSMADDFLQAVDA
jgi:hypothetical protein